MTDTYDPFAPAAAGGDFFKPKDHLHDLAIVLEPKKILRDQPHEYEGKKTTRDIAICDMAFFRNSQDVQTATPSLVKEGVQITSQILVADVERNDWMGKIACVVIRKPKQAYVYRPNEVAPDARAAAAQWIKNREAAYKEALDDMPDF